jgi:hypothetical protein
MNADFIWTLVGFVLTLLVFSYIFGDNPLFRLVSYLFVGVASGYAFVLLIYQVILPRLVTPLMNFGNPQWVITLVPLVLSGMLLTKLSPRLSSIGSIPMAYLVGCAAAIVIGGAVMGTLFQQTLATINLFDLKTVKPGGDPLYQVLQGIFLLIGTITTLAYFHFGARQRADQSIRRPVLVNLLAVIGQVFIAVTLGALFAGVFSAALTALIERLDFLRTVIASFF